MLYFGTKKRRLGKQSAWNVMCWQNKSGAVAFLVSNRCCYCQAYQMNIFLSCFIRPHCGCWCIFCHANQSTKFMLLNVVHWISIRQACSLLHAPVGNTELWKIYASITRMIMQCELTLQLRWQSAKVAAGMTSCKPTLGSIGKKKRKRNAAALLQSRFLCQVQDALRQCTGGGSWHGLPTLVL